MLTISHGWDFSLFPFNHRSLSYVHNSLAKALAKVEKYRMDERNRGRKRGYKRLGTSFSFLLPLLREKRIVIQLSVHINLMISYSLLSLCLILFFSLFLPFSDSITHTHTQLTQTVKKLYFCLSLITERNNNVNNTI